jgi:uncharacterized protein YfiM (DUF2279 family)
MKCSNYTGKVSSAQVTHFSRLENRTFHGRLCTHIGSAISLDNRRRGGGGADGRPVGAVVVLVESLSVGETLETGQPVAGRDARVFGQRGRRHGDASALGAVAAQQTGAARVGVRRRRRRQNARRLGRRLAICVRHHWTDGRSGGASGWERRRLQRPLRHF